MAESSPESTQPLASRASTQAAVAARTLVRDALLDLMTPATSLSAHVSQTVAAQQVLADKVASISRTLAAATVISPEDRELVSRAEAYAAKLRLSKKRLTVLHTSLEGTHSRLSRVHAYLKASAAAVERRNSSTEAEIEATLAADRRGAATDTASQDETKEE